MIQDDGIWCNKRIEFVKTKKKKKVIQTSEQIFQICIDCIVHNNIFWKMFFHYVLIFSVKCFICSVASHLLSSSVFEWPPNCCVLSNTLLYMFQCTWMWNVKGWIVQSFSSQKFCILLKKKYLFKKMET